MDQDRQDGVGPLAQGARMVAAAIASAALTATLVIVVGQAVSDRSGPDPVHAEPGLVRTGG